MKRHLRIIISVSFLLVMLVPMGLSARDAEPIVNTSWLEQNLSNPRLVILDVRKVEDYKSGHIPGSVNVFYGSWVVTKDGLRNEVPPADDLFDTIGSAGIDANSLVVIVSKTDTIGDRADATRVAWTLKQAGLTSFAVLDGGYNKWIADKKAVSTDPVRPKSKSYKGKTGDPVFVNKPYVLSRMGKATIVDSREAEFYEGKKKLDFVPKEGRIAGAIPLATAQAFTAEGTYKDKTTLQNMATAALGKDLSKEIIVYCDSGRVATIWAFLLSENFGYKNVKVYDGSAEDWTKEPAGPVEK